MNQKHLTFLYTEIGRGHPFYLDGIIEVFRSLSFSEYLDIDNVFDRSSGIPKLIWQTASWLYRNSDSHKLFSKLYEQLRKGNDYNNRSLIMKIMGRDLLKHYLAADNPLVVAHPLMVGILAGRENLVYQHGEVVVPNESLVRSASKVLVPTEDAKDRFLDFGYKEDQVSITGLCIEPTIVAQAEECYLQRLGRIKNSRQLTGLFVSSGAEPIEHVMGICSGIKSILKGGDRAVLIAKKWGRLSEEAKRAFEQFIVFDLSLDDNTRRFMESDSRLLLCEYKSRQDENKLASKVISIIDYMVSPSHERTNWGLGLGLPFFVLLPVIGPFAPLNYQLLKEKVFSAPIKSDSGGNDLSERIKRYRDEGRLIKMAESGWGQYPINGFEEIVRLLKEWFVH